MKEARPLEEEEWVREGTPVFKFQKDLFGR